MRIKGCMNKPDTQFTAYLRMEPSSERLKAAEDQATALIAQAAKQTLQTPERQRLAKRLGTERQKLLERLRELREKFYHLRHHSSSQSAAATNGTKT